MRFQPVHLHRLRSKRSELVTNWLSSLRTIYLETGWRCIWRIIFLDKDRTDGRGFKWVKSRGGRSIGSSDDRGGRGWRSRDAVRKFTANRGRKLKRNGTPLPDYLNMYKSGQLSSRPSFVHTSRKIVPSILSLLLGSIKSSREKEEVTRGNDFQSGS